MLRQVCAVPEKTPAAPGVHWRADRQRLVLANPTAEDCSMFPRMEHFALREYGSCDKEDTKGNVIPEQPNNE